MSPGPLDLKSFVRDVPDFPKPGIVFKDVMPLLAEPAALREVIARLSARIERPDAVVGIEARGLLFGVGLALAWGVPFVAARKAGKLPGPTIRQSYALEYGADAMELQAGALVPGQRVAIVDDLLATGGTARAAAQLVERLGARVAACLFVIELVGLGGRAALAAYPVDALMEFVVEE